MRVSEKQKDPLFGGLFFFAGHRPNDDFVDRMKRRDEEDPSGELRGAEGVELKDAE